MGTIRMNAEQYARYHKRLAQRFLPTVKRGILAGALRAIPKLQAASKEAEAASQNGKDGAFNTGNFVRSWRAETTENGARLFNLAPYSGVIEDGRRPGSKPPPSKVIEKWAQRRMGLSAQEAKKAAFLIARAIGKRGLRARQVMKLSLPSIVAMMEAEILHELEREEGKL